MTKRMAQDKRPDTTIAAVEATLALSDPIVEAPTVPTLEELCHVEMHGELMRFNHWLAGLLASHRIEIEVPDFIQLRPMIQACKSGMDGSFDTSLAWRLWFGSSGDAAQSRIRSLWQNVRALKCPPAERHADFVDALAIRLVELFTAAKQQQAERMTKRAAEPVARAQAAAQLLEASGPFVEAMDAYAAAAWKDVSNIVVDMRDQLAKLGRVARKDLA